MATVHDKEKELQREIARSVSQGLPGVEVLAVELTGRERFCVYVDATGGVDHALCERVSVLLRPYLDRYGVEVSSPGLERPLRTRAHFERAIGRHVRLKTPEGRRWARCAPPANGASRSLQGPGIRSTYRTTRSCGPI